VFEPVARAEPVEYALNDTCKSTLIMLGLTSNEVSEVRRNMQNLQGLTLETAVKNVYKFINKKEYNDIFVNVVVSISQHKVVLQRIKSKPKVKILT